MIIKNDAGENTGGSFGKAAEADWHAALSAYATRNNLSISAATLEFANTVEASKIYKRTKVTPRSEAIAKAAAIGNVSAEELAEAAFPKHVIRCRDERLARNTGRTRILLG